VVHHGLDDHGLFQNKHDTKQVVGAALDAQSYPKVGGITLADGPGIDDLQQQFVGNVAFRHALHRMARNLHATLEPLAEHQRVS
jgi:hypothetical protein